MKIAIAQFSTTNVPYLPYTEAVNREYCRINNYDYFIEKDDEKILNLLGKLEEGQNQYGINFPINEKNYIAARSHTWCKPKIILEILEKNEYDYVLFMDIDAIVCDFSIRIEEFIDENYDIVATEDCSHHSVMNAGVLLVKNSEWSKKFMQEWWDSGEALKGKDAPELSVAEDNLEKVGYFKINLWHDQTCLTYLYKNNEDYKNKIKIISSRSLNWREYKDNNFIFHAFCYGWTKYRNLNMAYYEILNIKPDFENKNLIELAELFHTDKESEHNYISNHYEKIFSPIKDKVKRICEIGVGTGGSLKLWKEYFRNSTVIGLDATVFDLKEDRIETIMIDASNKDEIINFCKNQKDKFDIIIDDASHRMYDQQMCLAEMFKILNDGGLYILEDLHTSVEAKMPEKACFGWGDPNRITTLELLQNFIDTKKLTTDYLDDSQIKYLEKNIESCEILYKPHNPHFSITSVIRKKDKNTKQTNIKNIYKKINTNKDKTALSSKIRNIIKNKYKK